VARARAVHRTFDRLDNEILDVVQAEDKVAVAFRMSGRQVGPLATTLGPLPPGGGQLELRVIDILTLTDGRVSKIWMVADELGGLSPQTPLLGSSATITRHNRRGASTEI
jgi:hypothetical protein